MAYPTGLEKFELTTTQLTRVMYAVWEEIGAENRMGKQHRGVQTRMLAGVVRVPGNGQAYPIYPLFLVPLIAATYADTDPSHPQRRHRPPRKECAQFGLLYK